MEVLSPSLPRICQRDERRPCRTHQTFTLLEHVMSHVEHFDTVILGSGQGGKLLAWHLGRSGQRVAVVERQWVGGSCPAVACLPSKNELWSARVAHLVRNAARFGTLVDNVRTDMREVRRRKQG